MEILAKVVEFLAAIAVGITAVRICLLVSRLWNRKHEKVVADSISTVASLMSIFVYIPFTAKFIASTRIPLWPTAWYRRCRTISVG